MKSCHLLQQQRVSCQCPLKSQQLTSSLLLLLLLLPLLLLEMRQLLQLTNLHFQQQPDTRLTQQP
jgi:hypothetical protein